MKNIVLKINILLVIALATISLSTFFGESPVLSVISQIREVPIYQVDRDDNYVSISFDAAWGAERTLSILDTLDEYNVKATFFLVNTWLEDYPELAIEIANRGHEIGLHSTTHPHFPELTAAEMEAELIANQTMIKEITGYDATIFRSPFGDYNNESLSVAASLGITTVQWSVDSLDWQDLSAIEIEERIMSRITSGDIILMHNDGLYTADALPNILNHLQEEGYTIVPVGDILLEGETTTDLNGTQVSL